MSTTWKPWLAFSVLGILACAVSGCQSATEPDEPSANTSVRVTEPVPDAQVPAPLPAPHAARSIPTTADLAPQTLPPLETLKQDAAQVVGAVDQDLKQAGQSIKAAAVTTLPIEANQAHSPPTPTASAPVLDAVKQDVNHAVNTLDQKTRRAAAEIKQSVRDKAGTFRQEVKQAVGNLERDVQSQVQALPETVIQKAGDLGKETLRGLRAPRPTVPPAPQ